MNIDDHDEKTRRKLDPWPVILSRLFYLDSHAIPGIIDSCGMTIDWSLTDRQDYSHKYREAAYRPRINKAYDALDTDDKLRVVYILAEELSNQDLAVQLNSDLQRIGWRLEAGTLLPGNESVRELFFPQDTQHDAYVRLKEIMRRAQYAIRIIDPYLDETIFVLLGNTIVPMIVEFLTKKLPADFSHEAARFQEQYPQVTIEARRSADFHDRFIVIDNAECWHLGHSIKDAGKRAFMLSRIEDPRNVESLLQSSRAAWSDAQTL